MASRNRFLERIDFRDSKICFHHHHPTSLEEIHLRDVEIRSAFSAPMFSANELKSDIAMMPPRRSRWNWSEREPLARRVSRDEPTCSASRRNILAARREFHSRAGNISALSRGASSFDAVVLVTGWRRVDSATPSLPPPPTATTETRCDRTIKYRTLNISALAPLV